MSTQDIDKQRMLQLLGQVGDVVVKNQNVDVLLTSIVHLIQSVLEVERCSIMLLHAEQNYLQMVAAAGIPEEDWQKIRVELGQGYAGQVALTGVPMLVKDTTKIPRHKPKDSSRYRTNSFICVPLKIHGKTIGVVNVNDKRNRQHFTEEDVQSVSTLSNFVAIALENTQLLLLADRMKNSLHEILDGLFLGVITVDPNGSVIHVNHFAHRLLGIPTQSSAGKSLSWLLDDALYSTMRNLMDDTLLTQAPQSRQFDWQPGEEQRIVPLAITTTLIYKAKQEIEFVLFIIDDHTLQREVDKLRRLDEVKNSFIAMVSHELRTPLTSIKGALHLLQSTATDNLNDSQQHLLGLVSRNTERLITQINNLLDVNSIESQNIVLVRRPSNIVKLIKSIVPKYQKLAAEKKIELSFECSEEEIVANVDPDKFPKIVENLLDNALKFTRINGSVWLKMQRDDGTCEIRVKDTGVGIPTRHQPHIFDKFFQGNHTMTREVGGAGLGLYIIKALVGLHGGCIEMVRSSQEGSEFRVVVPITEPSELHETTTQGEG